MSLSNNGVVENVSTIQSDNAWPGMPRLEDVLKGGVVDEQLLSNNTSSQPNGHDRLEIPGAEFLPESEFAISQKASTYENNPRNHWPKIFVEIERNSQQKIVGANVTIRPSDDTVDAGILHTRVKFTLIKAGGFHLAIGADNPIGFKLIPVSESEMQELLNFAKLYRKLKYIEDVFGVEFLLPNHISPEAVRLTDITFRGITEGEFAIRSQYFAFDIFPSEIDLSSPPFNGPGGVSSPVDEDVKLFGHELPTRPVTVKLNKAELANPRVIEQIRNGQDGPIHVRFEVLDNQIIHRFESYIRQPRIERIKRLTQFKDELAREEPKELVDLVDEPLQGDVSPKEAVQIAVGWQFYNRLPDRFCPQEPEIDQATGHWRVPLWLVYTGGEGGPVGEIIIDRKTGRIIQHTPMEEIRDKAMTLAKKLLHV